VSQFDFSLENNLRNSTDLTTSEFCANQLSQAGSAVIAPLHVRLERLDDTAHKLRELMQRWDNRLVLKGLSLAEAYINRRIAILLVVEIGGSAADGRYATRTDNPCATRQGRQIILVLHAMDDSGSNRQDNREASVLVRSIQAVETPKTVVRSFVGLYYICQKKSEVGRESLYFSVSRLFYKRFPVVIHREVDGFRVLATAGHNLTGNVVECGSEIVSCIPDNGGDISMRIDVFRGGDRERMSASLLVEVHSETVWVKVVESREPLFNIIDVLIGPFDL